WHWSPDWRSTCPASSRPSGAGDESPPRLDGCYDNHTRLALSRCRTGGSNHQGASLHYPVRLGMVASRWTLVHLPSLPTLHTVDPRLASLVESEAERQHDKLRMIPSENYVSAAVLEATGTVLTNKYSEGYPGRRFY